MLTYRHSQNPSQSDAAQKFLGAKAPIGWHAWPLSPTSLASQRGHRGARRPRGSPGPARCTWLRPRGGRLSGRRSCAGSGRAVAGRLRTRCSARRAWLGHGRSLTLSLYLCGTPQRPPSPPTPPPRLAVPASSSAPGLAPSGLEQPAGRRRARSLSDDNPQDRDLDSPLHRHLPCLLFSTSSMSIIFSPPNKIHPRRQFFITSVWWKQKQRDQRKRGAPLKGAQQPQGHFGLCFTKTLPGNMLSFLPVLYDSRKEKKKA